MIDPEVDADAGLGTQIRVAAELAWAGEGEEARQLEGAGDGAAHGGAALPEVVTGADARVPFGVLVLRKVGAQTGLDTQVTGARGRLDERSGRRARQRIVAAYVTAEKWRQE